MTNWDRLSAALSNEEREQLATLFFEAQGKGYGTLGIEFSNHRIHLYRIEKTILPMSRTHSANSGSNRMAVFVSTE